MTHKAKAPEKLDSSIRPRKKTLAELGYGVCERCCNLFVLNFEGMGPNPDMAVYRERTRFCSTCLGLPAPATPTFDDTAPASGSQLRILFGDSPVAED
jgi:hypothetical protein